MARPVYFLVFLAQLLACVTALSSPQPQLTQSHQAVCVPVKYTGKSAYVEVSLKRSNLKKDEKIPALIFHITDIFGLDIPFMEEFNKDPARFSAGDKFDVNTASVSDEKILNSYLAKDKTLKLNVKESGYYCVYTAASSDYNFVAPIIYKSSNGYLDYFENIRYSQTRIGIFVVILVTFVLFRDLIKSVGQDFSNLNNISVVSKGAIVYVLLPNILIEVLVLLSDGILNNIKHRGFVSELFRDLVEWLEGCYNILLQSITLMFCMGYGVLYYHRQTRSYRELPSSKVQLIKYLLAGNLTVFLLFKAVAVIGEKGDSFMVGMGNTGGVTVSAAYNTLAGGLALFSFVWLVLSIYHGLQTLKTIKEFPPYSESSVEDAASKNEALHKAFKRSLSLIFLLPIYVTVFVTFVVMFRAGADFADTYGFDDVDQRYIKYLMPDFLIDHSNSMYYQVWNDFLVGLAVIVGIFFIWVKGNQGLVIDTKEEEYIPAPADEVDSDPEFV